MTFDGASVLVTGGSRGIGKAIALRFAELGAKRVAIGYLRNDKAAEETAEELRGAGTEPLLVRGNVASERVAQEAAELGPFDVLVHNAATGVIRPALETEDKHWDWTLNANAKAFLSLARAAAPRIRVNAVSGGVVDTEALDWFPNKEQMLASVKRTPAGRLVEPGDIAGAVSFLCSDDAAMVRGQTLVVDGGFSLPA